MAPHTMTICPNQTPLLSSSGLDLTAFYKDSYWTNVIKHYNVSPNQFTVFPQTIASHINTPGDI